MLPCHARCVLSCLRCNGHSLLCSSYLFKIGRIENPSCNACGHSSQDTSHLIPHCPATDFAPLALWRLSVSLKSLIQALGSCPSSGGLHGVPPSPHSSYKGSGTNYNRREGISPHFLTQTFFAELKQQKVAKTNHWSVTCC